MSSLYAKLIAVIEQKITPMAGAIGQQKYVTSIRDGFITALPFMIVGSFLLVFIFPPFSPDTTWGFARAWLQFSLDHRDALMLPFNFSMGVMTLFIAVGIAASLAKHHNLDSLTAGMLSLMSFLLVAAPLKDGQISTAYFSGQGIFTAILVAIYSTELYAFLKRHNITIRLPPEVPAGVARSFEILIPVLAIVLTLHPLNLFIEAQLGMIIPEAIMSLVKPLVAASDTLPAILLSVLVCQVLWFAGIHGALIVTGIMNPFWMANLSINQAAMAAGTAIPHIYVQGFWDHYLLIGGVGSTLPLALMLLIKAPWVTLATEDCGLKFSARNQFAGSVTRITEGAVNATVHIKTDAGFAIIAVVTNESQEEMKLVEGSRVIALIKASAILLATRA